MESVNAGRMKSEKHRKVLCQGLQDLWEKKLLCDAAIISRDDKDNVVLNAHKVVLMSCSRFFYSQFTSNCADTDSSCLLDASHKDISTILGFIYTGNLYLSNQNFEGVRRLAKLLFIDEAEKLCEVFVQSDDVQATETDGDLDAENPRVAFETETTRRFEPDYQALNVSTNQRPTTAKSQHFCSETTEVCSEVLPLQSNNAQNETEHADLLSSVKNTSDSNDEINTKSKTEKSGSRGGKRNVIQSSAPNAQLAKDQLEKGITPKGKRITQSSSKRINVLTANAGSKVLSGVKEQNSGAKKWTSLAIESQWLENISSEVAKLSETTSKPTLNNGSGDALNICTPSDIESDNGVKDSDIRKSTRVKRKCSTPKKLEGFTLLKPQVASLGFGTGAISKKGRGRPCKNISTSEDELDVTPSNTTIDIELEDRIESDQNRKRGRGRPRKQVENKVSTEKSLDKNLTSGRHIKATRKKSETESSFQNDDGACKDNPDVKRKRGRPKGSKNKKESIDLGVDDALYASLRESNLATGHAHSSAAMDDNRESPNILKKAKFVSNINKKRRCRRCHEEFDSLKLLEKHRIGCRKTVSFDKPNKYKRKRCGTCQLDFEDYTSFQEHRSKVHKTERKKQLSRKPYSCDLCEQTFRYENFLACHRFSKHKIPYDDSKFTILTCQQCDYVTVNRWRYKMHMNQHDNLRPFICEVCGKGFNVSSSLATHKKSHSEGKYECDECGKKFTHQHTRVNHVRRVHKKELPFLCHMCLFKCFGKTELLHHLDKEHNIPLPKGYVRYNCELCDFMTFRKFHFENHMNVHGGEKQFECKICHKKYVSKMVLRCHMQFHKEPKHKCTWEGCKYAAVQKRRLEQHIRLMHTHQDEKPYPCHLCTYRAALQGNLNLHLRNVHHVDVRKRKGISKAGETTGPNADKKGDNSDPQICHYPVTNINSSDIVQMAVASCGDISSSSGQIPDQGIETETVVIYTTDSVIPTQLTPGQVIEFRGQSSAVVSHSMATMTSMAGDQSVTIMTTDDSVVQMPEQQSSVHDKVLQRNYHELQGHLSSATGSDTGGQIHFQSNHAMSQNEGEHTSALPQNIHTELTVLNNDLHQRRMAQVIPTPGAMTGDMQTVQVHNADNQEITTSELTPSLDQEMLNTQYSGECFIPDSRNLNLMVQTMENREGFSDQNAYWTNF